MEKRELLEKHLEMLYHNLLCYSANYCATDKPAKGYEKEWKEAKAEYETMKTIVNEYPKEHKNELTMELTFEGKIITQHNPVKLVLITMSSKELEQAFHDLLLKETGINMTFNLETDYGIPTIMLTVPEWDNLTENERLALEKLSYSFDFPDEDLNEMLQHLFKTDDIEAQKAGMTNETEFEINLYISLEEYERLLTGLAT